AHGGGGRLPDRAQPARQPRPGDEDAGRTSLRAGNPEAQRREGCAGGQQVRHRLGQPDPQLRARPEPDQGSAHRHRAQRYAEGARRRPGRVRRGQPQGRPGGRVETYRRGLSHPSDPSPPSVPDCRQTMTESSQPQPERADDNALIAERRAKLAALRGQGIAFPNDFRRHDYAQDLQAEYADAEAWSGEALEATGRRVALAGRMLAKRVMGKAAFVQLQDDSGRIQLFLQSAALGERYDAFKTWDVGDIVAVEGTLMRTRTGELSVKAETLRLLTKSLRPLPDKWHGLADVEQRYRQRYVDL